MTNNDNVFLFGYQSGASVQMGLQEGNTLYALDQSKIPSLDWLLSNVKASELLSTLQAAVDDELPSDTTQTLKGLLNQQAVWAAGVTYKQSEEARERESGNSTVYTRVYGAERPEVFWKSTGTEVVSEGDMVGIRADAVWSVPEAELTLVINAFDEVIGFTIGNDMSSRDIEGENPLYLPQAKVYDDACALASRIWLKPNADNWQNLSIIIEIERSGELVFSGRTSTSQLKRTLPELVDYLVRCKSFAHGVLLMTGTGVVPPDEFILEAGDIVRITIEPIGTLTNTVHVVGKK